MKPDELLTTEEVAALLKIPEKTLHTWRYRNQGPAAIKIGKHLRFRASELDRWIEELEASQKQAV